MFWLGFLRNFIRDPERCDRNSFFRKMLFSSLVEMFFLLLMTQKKFGFFFCCSRKRVAWDNSCFAKTKFITQKILLCPLNLLSIAEIARVVNFLIYLQSSTRPFMRKARIWSKSISINAHDQNNRVKNEAIKFHRPWLDKCMHGSVQSSPIKHDISSRRWSCAPWRLLLDIFLGSPT